MCKWGEGGGTGVGCGLLGVGWGHLRLFKQISEEYQSVTEDPAGDAVGLFPLCRGTESKFFSLLGKTERKRGDSECKNGESTCVIAPSIKGCG